MPFSVIKIDKSFVGELETSNDSLTIVRTLVLRQFSNSHSSPRL